MTTFFRKTKDIHISLICSETSRSHSYKHIHPVLIFTQLIYTFNLRNGLFWIYYLDWVNWWYDHYQLSDNNLQKQKKTRILKFPKFKNTHRFELKKTFLLTSYWNFTLLKCQQIGFGFFGIELVCFISRQFAN